MSDIGGSTDFEANDLEVEGPMNGKNGKDGRSRRQPKDQTRRMLLDTGQRLLAQHGLPMAIEVRLTDVLAEHGLTTGAAYQIWDSQLAYQNELALHIARRFNVVDIRDRLVDVEFDFDDPIKTVRSLGRHYFEVFVADNEFYSALRIWAIGDPTPELEAAVVDGFAVLQQEAEALVEMFLEVSGLRMREGFTSSDLTTAWGAVTKGFAIRSKFDPGAVQPDGDKDILIETLVAIVQYYVDLK